MEISPRVRVMGGLVPGTVYYFKEESHGVDAPPHFFVVINTNPLSDATLVLVCASSQTDSVKRRRRNVPISTLVEMTHSDYADFNLPTIFDCNHVYEKTVDQLIKKLESGELGTHSAEMNLELVSKLRMAVVASPLVKRELKELLLT